jgi:tRNA (adenine37-N6)-methyltransferase
VIASGVTVCRLPAGWAFDCSEGLDAVDETPVLDCKPYMREFAAREPVRQPEWATELMSGYWASGGNSDRTKDST